MPLAQGFGFGAGRIREESQNVARQAAERKESRVRDLLSEPVYSAATATLPAPSHEPLPKAVAERALPRSAPMRQPTPPARAMYTPPQPVPARRTRAFFAWVLDAIVAASAFVIAMGANYALVPETIAGPAAQAISGVAKVMGAQNIALFALMVRVLLSTMVLVWLGQMAIMLLSGSSAGRYAMGIFVRRGPWRRRFIDLLFASLSEALTVGGLLTFPLVILMPSRVHLAPWVRFEQTD